jgi:hypothetical protein
MKFPTNMTTEKLLSAFLRAAFIGCVIALAILAWMPAKAMTRTILGAHAEHFIAYLGTAVVMGLAYRKRPLLAVQCTLLIMYAAFLEAGQVYSPDRHPSFEDLAFRWRHGWRTICTDGARPHVELAENRLASCHEFSGPPESKSDSLERFVRLASPHLPARG